MFLHDQFVLVYLISGEVTIEVDKNDYALSPGNMLLIFPNKPHRTKPVAGCENHLLHISFSVPGDFSSLIFLKDVIISTTNRQRRLLAEMVDDFSENWQQDGRCCNTLAYRLGEFLELLSCRSAVGSGRRNGVVAPEASADSWKKELVRNIANYCYAHLDRHISIEELAHEVKYSPSNLRLCFRKFTGTSLGRYLRNCRLNQATALLRNSGLNIKEIAERCGYASIASFSRTYKREAGVSPQEIRRLKH